jgi:oligopeptide/dipeptide ABC transporter ATP-binding protein
MSRVLEIEGLTKHFQLPRSRGGDLVHAVDGVDLAIDEGEILGLVGESGSGKSTLGQCIVRLLDPTAGHIRLLGQDITRLSRRRLRPFRRTMHMVFQDPYSSLDPRMTAGQIVAEPIRMHRQARGRKVRTLVEAMFERVGLSPDMRSRYPHELSGGQRQRVGLARSLILRPRLIIADEPVSALDVSVQAAIINLLMDLQRDMGFSCLFVAHDLATVEFLCQRVAVMYLGRIVEQGDREQIFTAPQHPYTQSLLSAAVVPDPVVQRQRKRVLLQGDIPSPIDPPPGCHFHTRCPIAEYPLCASEEPRLMDVLADGHLAACHLVTRNTPRPNIVNKR